MKFKKEPLFVITLLAMILPLSGCAKLDDYVGSKVQAAADEQIHAREEYLQYEQYVNDGVLDANGTYALALPIENDEETDIDITGLVPVTFARNSFLSCVYYVNSEDQTVSSDICYFAPGDSIYVAGVTANNSNSNLYGFSEFRIWSYDNEGRRGTSPYKTVQAKNGLLFQIPQDYIGSGFSIEPIGAYDDRDINVKAYFINNSGERQDLDGGTWDVNGAPFKGSTSISPVESFTMVYDYSNYANDYYFVSSEPACWFSKESNHTVIFREASSNETNTDYDVCLHQYVTLTVTNSTATLVDTLTDSIPFISSSGKGIITSIYKGTDDIMPKDAGIQTFDIPNLRVGDKITIRVLKDYKLTGTGVNIGSAVPLGSNADNGYEYTIIVPDTNNGIKIDISKRNSDAEGKYEGYSIENANLILKRADGSTVLIGDELPAESEKVTVSIVPHTNYYISGKGVSNDQYSKTMKYSDFVRDVSTIISEHPAVHIVTITLDYDDECGTCQYKLNGEDVTTNPIRARVGQKIKLEFTVNSQHKIVRDGWISDTWANLLGSNKASAEIEVTANMDGAKIGRDTFGIKVE